MFSKNCTSCTASEADAESEAPGKKPRQGITSDIIKELTDCNARLSGQLKKRQVRCQPFQPSHFRIFILDHPLYFIQAVIYILQVSFFIKLDATCEVRKFKISHGLTTGTAQISS